VREVLLVSSRSSMGVQQLTAKTLFPPLGNVLGSLSRVEFMVGPLCGPESVNLPSNSRIQPAYLSA
jgi:hypothetical protein